MKSIFNKANAPYLVIGTLATATLIASGVFAVAPYIGFLAPVAALSVGLPLIVVGAVFSVVAIALSCAAISKNNTIAEKNKVIDQKTKDIECKDNFISRKKDELNQKNNEIASLKEQLDEKEIDVRNYKNSIDGRDFKIEAGRKENSKLQDRIINQEQICELAAMERKMTVDNAVHVWDVSQSAFCVVKSSVKYTCDSIIECSKSSINSVGTVLKSVCDVIAYPTENLKFPSIPLIKVNSTRRE